MSIQERIKKVRTDQGLTQEQFSASIGMKRANYAQMEIGKQEPDLDVISKIVRIYHISYAWLIDGKESSHLTPPKEKNTGKVTGKVAGKAGVSEPVNSYTTDLTPTIREHVIDTDGMRLVPIADIKAAAGDGYLNAEQFDQDDVLRLPAHMVKSGYHLCIRVKGTSMAPTIQDGGYVIVRLLDRSEWSTMLNDRIYVVVDNEGKTYLKRVRNRFSDDKGFIVLSSDSPDKTSHPSFNLHPDEVMHIWYVAWYFTAKMPNIHDQYYNRLTRLEDNFENLNEQFKNVRKKLDLK